jgi:hypothetical protein
MILEYIRHQEQDDQRIEQMNLWQWVAAYWRLIFKGRVSDPIYRFERFTT